MDGSGGNPIEDLAREMWEAFATRSQEASGLKPLQWRELDAFDRQTWMMLARVAMTHRVM